MYNKEINEKHIKKALDLMHEDKSMILFLAAEHEDGRVTIINSENCSAEKFLEVIMELVTGLEHLRKNTIDKFDV